ncbi:MAG: Na(+)/H(+) antiporter subunit B [Parvibaculaceae bacterium]
MRHHLVLRVVAKFLLPYILLYALYVQWHGDYGPGGGFQAGVIFAVGFILYALVYGVEALSRLLPRQLLLIGLVTGLMLYAGTGLVGLFQGLNYLDYNKLASNTVHAQEWGILFVELGVGIAVASAMIAIFIAFATREPEIDDEDW